MMTNDATTDTWIISGRELEAIEALRDVQTAFPDLTLSWQQAPAATLATREPQRDLNVVEIIVTAALVKATDGLLEMAYQHLKRLLKSKNARVKKKGKPRKK